MRVDCHIHSAAFSACSRTDPDTLCALALERGLDGVALTEHHVVWPEEMLAKYAKRYAPLRLYPGVEVSTIEGFDVVCINPPRDFSATPLTPFLDLMLAMAPVRDEVFLFIAHPFRYSTRYSPRLKAMLQEMDGVEVNSVNILRGGCGFVDGRYVPDAASSYQRARADWDLIPLYNSDSHHPDSVGGMANELDGPPPEDPAELVAMLRASHPRERQNTQVLGPFLERLGVVTDNV